jgi:hypothetical protein
MGYFANGTDGAIWESKNCDNCVHNPSDPDKECPIMLIHGLYNYDQKNKGNEDLHEVLDILIPIGENPYRFNCECSMRIKK